ncbi:MAG: serine/threonine protein kinase [Leptolyngbyaceae cyanobacterium CSU_1_3]|nr:serine/threonine protein kinase [Leptolyngbyaceae cyanobacterium CSU_1_3]
MPYLFAPELNRSKYRLLGMIGQGQFGHVHCAMHRKTGQVVALKALERSRFPTHQFLRELRFLISLQHPNIVACHALEHVDDRRYLVMDYCEGGTLRSLMEAHRLHPALIVKLVADVLSGLDHAHSRGIVHCDIKPENILLTLQPLGWTAQISDFGIARFSKGSAQEEASVTGSPAYMAPERFYGQYSQSTDLYAIGIVLFELLVGHRPFSGTPADLMSAHLNQSVKIPEFVPAPLQAIIFKALQKLQARRFQSAEEMLLALKLCPIFLKPSPRSSHFSLLLPTRVLLKYPLESLRQERVRHPIAKLAVVENSLLPGYDRYLGRASKIYETVTVRSGSQIYNRSYCKGLLSTSRQQGEEMHLTPLSEPVRELLVRPQGCFAVTERSIYLCQNQVQRLFHCNQPFVAEIETQGRWAAIADGTHLKIGPLDRLEQCTPLPWALGLSQLIALNARHLLALRRTAEGTQLMLYNRRSQKIGNLKLAVHLDRVISSAQPYQLAAIEPKHPRSLLLIHLKPLKLIRVSLEVTPKFIAATTWGYILIDEQSTIVLLDHQGIGISRIEGLTHASAMTAFSEFGLLIATWNGNQGRLHTLNLKEFMA